MRGIHFHEDFGWSAAVRLALIGGGVSAIGSLIGSGKSSSASKSAANTSLEATLLGTQEESTLFNYAASELAPYVTQGYASTQGAADVAASANQGNAGQWYYNQATGQLQNASGYQQQAQGYVDQSQNYLQQAAGMTPPSQVTEQWLQNTPGYQWNLQQNLQAVQSAAAARGLGVSGASLKGAATYASGLADSTYQNQFNNAQTAYQDVLNQSTQSLNQSQSALNLSSAAQSSASGYVGQGNAAQTAQAQQYQQNYNLASLGESAAAMTGQAATTTGGNYANTLTSGAQQYGNYLSLSGEQQSAGVTGASNAINQALQNASGYSVYTGLNQSLAGSGTSGY